MADELPPCKYGFKCYRKNPQHFKEYSHPNSEKPRKRASVDDSNIDEKRSRLEEGCAESTLLRDKSCSSHSSTSSPSKSQNDSSSFTPKPPNTQIDPALQVELSARCNQFSYFLTYVHRGIDNSYNDGSALTLRNVIYGTRGELIDVCMFSYMYDLDWIMQQFKPDDRQKPVTVVQGLKGDSRIELLEQRESYSKMKIVQARLDIMYGVHHTKMMILRFDTGIRVMITTANLIPTDWFQKTQAIWCSPLFPKGTGDSVTCFKADLIDYLSAYRSSVLNDWVTTIKLYDMTKCRVFLIASVPGRHSGEKKHQFGHLKLRKVLRQHGPTVETANWPVISQFSSIGKLGSKAESWLTGEFLKSLAELKGNISTGALPKMKLVYPSVENVRNSLEGYMAGSCLPFAKQTYDSQPYIRALFHQWKSDCRGRTLAAPHIKSYMKVSEDCKSMAWFLMTSSNLSKAAWGVLEKQEAQLMIRSYEIGVIFIPQMFNFKQFKIDNAFTGECSFPIPFDLPLTPYQTADEPWIVDKRIVDKKDSLGEFWNPHGS